MGVPLQKSGAIEMEKVQTGDKMRIRLALRKTFQAAKDAPFMKNPNPISKSHVQDEDDGVQETIRRIKQSA